MLPIKLLSSNRKFFKFLIISLFFFQNILAEEKSIDIWNNKNKPKSENNRIQEKLIQEPKIDISKLNQNQNELITISESQSENSLWKNFIESQLQEQRKQKERVKDLWDSVVSQDLITIALSDYLKQQQGEWLRPL